MERCKSKRVGESFKGGVMNEDMISELPKPLLRRILSLLPTKNVIATSVLSKRWKSLWKKIPNLEFICNGANDDLKRFTDIVCKSLLSHKAQVLQSLRLEINSYDESNMVNIEILIALAFGLHVRELSLHVSSAKTSFSFPTSLFHCEPPEALILSGFIHVHVPFPVCLKSLKTLHLDKVDYEDEESVVNFLSGCSSLENLVVNRFVYDELKTFTIAVPSLQRLTLIAVDEDEMSSVYVINAPCLKYLRLEGFIDFESCLFENTPELVKANIDMNDGDMFSSSLVYKSSTSSGSEFNGVIYIPVDNVRKETRR